MVKSLSERIAARSARRHRRSEPNRATFLALRNEVKQAIDDGWSGSVNGHSIFPSYGHLKFPTLVSQLTLFDSSARTKPALSLSLSR
ncbi:MAG: TraK family protein [Betaproteobacteria bacterium]